MTQDASEGPKKEGRLEKVIVTLLVVLVSLLSYSVGVMSGKKLSDREYAMKNSETKSMAASEEQAGEEPEMTEEEINQAAGAAIENAETSKKELNASVGEAAAQPVAAHGKSPVEDATKIEAPKVQLTKNLKSEGAVASSTEGRVDARGDERTEERTPSSIKKTVAPAPAAMPTLQYTVQVASYPDLKDAENLAVSLVKKGYPAFPFTVEVNGQTWHRVSIGG